MNVVTNQFHIMNKIQTMQYSLDQIEVMHVTCCYIWLSNTLLYMANL